MSILTFDVDDDVEEYLLDGFHVEELRTYRCADDLDDEPVGYDRFGRPIAHDGREVADAAIADQKQWDMSHIFWAEGGGSEHQANIEVLIGLLEKTPKGEVAAKVAELVSGLIDSGLERYLRDAGFAKAVMYHLRERAFTEMKVSARIACLRSLQAVVPAKVEVVRETTKTRWSGPRGRRVKAEETVTVSSLVDCRLHGWLADEAVRLEQLAERRAAAGAAKAAATKAAKTRQAKAAKARQAKSGRRHNRGNAKPTAAVTAKAKPATRPATDKVEGKVEGKAGGRRRPRRRGRRNTKTTQA